MSPVEHLPTELLIAVFDAVVRLNDTILAHETLLCASRVCRQWRGAAAQVLLSHVEVTKKDHAIALIELLKKKSPAVLIETLVVGGGGTLTSDSVDTLLLYSLLALSPRLRKLVLLHQDGMDCLDAQPSLPLLTDVTIAAAARSPSIAFEGTFIQQLPPTVRFLQLPCAEGTRVRYSARFHAPPQFQLYALTVPDFPTSSTEWLLAHSGDTLQCLTVVYLAKLDCLVKQHPGLRSLKILGRMSAASASSAEGFSGLRQLERLEIRDTVFNAAILDTLPPSVRYLRFWSGKVARKVVEMLEEGKLTNVHTIHWDYWSTKEDERPVHGTLREVCTKRGVELRLYERRDGGRRPGAGPDTSYEEYMRRSCFLHDKTATNSPPSSFVHSEASVTKMPMRVLRDLVEANASLLPHFSAVSPFADNLRGSWPGIWEECFSGHGAWLEDVLPKLKTKRTDGAGE